MNYLQNVFALLFVLSLILAIYVVLQRLSGRFPQDKTRSIQVIESVSLGNKRDLYLVQVQEQCFLLGATDHGISMMSAIKSGIPWQGHKTVPKRQPSIVERLRTLTPRLGTVRQA